MILPTLLSLLGAVCCPGVSPLQPEICSHPHTCDWLLPQTSTNAFTVTSINKFNTVVFKLHPHNGTSNYGTISSRPIVARDPILCQLNVTVTLDVSEDVADRLVLQIQKITRRGVAQIIHIHPVYIVGTFQTITAQFPVSPGWPFLVSLMARLTKQHPNSKNPVVIHNLTVEGCDIVTVPRQALCTFDHDVNGNCDWINLKKGDADWLRHRGETPTPQTGPSYDHTFLTKLGFYMYFESHGPTIRYFSRLHLRSKLFPSPPPSTSDPLSPDYMTCNVSFAYHKRGVSTHIGRLSFNTVKACRPNEDLNTVRPHNLWKNTFRSRFTRENKWQLITVPLVDVNAPYYLRFDAIPRGKERGDQAIDDIALTPQCFGIGLVSRDYEANLATNVSTIIANLSSTDAAVYYSEDESQVCDLYEKITIAAVTSSTFQVIPNPEEQKKVEFVMTSCGARGRFGPKQAQCDEAYRNSFHKVRVIEEGPWRGVQVWVVPETGEYEISSHGAHGGKCATNLKRVNLFIGYAYDYLNLTKGEEIYVLVAQPGEDACSNSDTEEQCYPRDSQDTNVTWVGGGGGGGGASYVFKRDNATGEVILLLVASGSPGETFSSGANVSALDAKLAGWGGGYNTSGKRLTDGRSLIQGSVGGAACDGSRWPASGGFGGGGGACSWGGGGGGLLGGLLSKKATNGNNYVVTAASGNNRAVIQLLVDQVTEVVIKRIIPCPCEFQCKILNVATRAFECSCPLSEVLHSNGHSCIATGMLIPENKVTLSNEKKDEGVSVAVIVSSSVAGLLILTFIVAMLVFCKYWRQHKRSLNSSMKADLFPLPPGQLLPSDPSRPSRRVQYNPHYFANQDLQPVPREMLVLLKPLGQGAFGLVYQGVMMKEERGTDKQEYQVAIKTLPEHSTEQAEMDFLMEAMILSKFNHDNIVHFIGVCFEMHPRYIVLELLEGGDLKSFLREYRNKHSTPNALTLTIKDLIKLAFDVAQGCRHLEDNHFIHRDIAARNCLLTSKSSDRIAKIADFGMSRDIYRADYYKKGGKAVLPVKWMPPEAFMDGIFTTKTDVWSFGVLLWEVFSMGLMPYPWLGNYEVMEFVMSGGRMDLPENCAPAIYGLMLQCWDSEANNRPTFSHIILTLTQFMQNDEIINRELPLYQDYRMRRKINPPAPVTCHADNTCHNPDDSNIIDNNEPHSDIPQSSSQAFTPQFVSTPGSTIPLLSNDDDIFTQTKTAKSADTVPNQSNFSGIFSYKRIPTSDYDMEDLESPKTELPEKLVSGQSTDDVDRVAETTFTDVKTKPGVQMPCDKSPYKNIRDVCSLSLEQLPRRKGVGKSLNNDDMSSSLKRNLDTGRSVGDKKTNLMVSGSLKNRPRSNHNVDDKVPRSQSHKIKNRKQMYDVNNYLLPRVTCPYECDKRVTKSNDSYSPLLEDCEKDESNCESLNTNQLPKDPFV